jgi:hypothetical protein
MKKLQNFHPQSITLKFLLQKLIISACIHISIYRIKICIHIELNYPEKIIMQIRLVYFTKGTFSYSKIKFYMTIYHI